MAEEDAVFAPPGTRRLCVMRDGHAVVRDWQIPKPTVLVDSREQQPFDLVGQHPNWIKAQRPATLKTGDYSVEGNVRFTPPATGPWRRKRPQAGYPSISLTGGWNRTVRNAP